MPSLCRICDTYTKFRKIYSRFFMDESNGYMARRVPMKSTVVKNNRGGKNTRLTRRGWPTPLSAL